MSRNKVSLEKVATREFCNLQQSSESNNTVSTRQKTRNLWLEETVFTAWNI